jgi:hypothetical protein
MNMARIVTMVHQALARVVIAAMTLLPVSDSAIVEKPCGLQATCGPTAEAGPGSSARVLINKPATPQTDL